MASVGRVSGRGFSIIVTPRYSTQMTVFSHVYSIKRSIVNKLTNFAGNPIGSVGAVKRHGDECHGTKNNATDAE